MLNYILIVAQIIVLLVFGVLLWQVWYFFKRKDIPDDEPLGEERINYLTRRLRWIFVFVAAEVLLQLTSAILRFFEVI